MITQLHYPKRVNWYNSERREYQGEVNYYDLDNHEFTDFGSLNQFHIDISNTSASNKKNLTLFTFANGVKIDYEYYMSENTDDAYKVTYQLKWIDVNGLEIRRDALSIATFYKSVNSMSSCLFYFTPTAVSYTSESPSTTDTEATYYSRATFYYVNDDVEAGDILQPLRGKIPLYDIPGQRVGWTTQYIRSIEPYYYDEDFDNYRDTIIENGDDTPITPILPSDDTSTTGGGDQAEPDYNPLSDPVEFPGLPTGGSAIATGFIRVYTPTTSQLQQLAGLLWSDSFVDTIQKVQNDPMEAIISLHSLPMSLSSGTAECRIGNFNSGITMNTVSSQYVKRDLGSILVPEHWASALDYGPYNTVDIFLPYIGVRSLQIDDIVGKVISVEYNVDVLSGATVASIKCGGSVLYTYNTSLIAYHPISQSSYGPLLQSTLGAMGNVVSGAVSGGIGGAVGGGLGSAINVATSKHSTVSRGGSIGGNSGCLGSFVPYLIIHRPIQSLASGFAHFKGYPSNITATLGSVSGYTEVESVHLNGITCTDNEKAEIEALLYNGVIL